MKWRAAKAICSPRRSMTDGAFFVAQAATELQKASRFIPRWTGMGRVYVSY